VEICAPMSWTLMSVGELLSCSVEWERRSENNGLTMHCGSNNGDDWPVDLWLTGETLFLKLDIDAGEAGSR